jgi:AraC family ethanolamine operon transcriptional activator
VTINSTTTTSLQRRSFAYNSLETADAEQHSYAISECDHVYEQVERGPFRGRIAELLLDSVHIVRDQVFNPIRYAGPAWTGSQVFLSLFPSAGAAFLHGRQLGTNAIIKYPRNHYLRAFCNGPTDCIAISIKDDAVMEEAALLTGEEISPAALRQALFVPNAELVDRFQRSGAGRLAQVAEAPHLLDDLEWRRAAKQGVTQLLLDIIQSGTSAPQKLPPPSTRAYIVDKAIEYMNSCSTSLPELSDVCRVVRASPRTLRYSFEEIVGVSPWHYMLSLRLQSVRRELREGGGANGIHRVAQRHGFNHMGRFALFYQQAFGERPSDTCRQTSAAPRARPTKPVGASLRRSGLG